MTIAQDYKDYYGDQKDLYINGSNRWRSQAHTIETYGELMALQFIKGIKNGTIKLEDGETIKIIWHSQGGAVAAGFAKYLNANLKTHKVEVVHYLAPHQPTHFEHDA